MYLAVYKHSFSGCGHYKIYVNGVLYGAGGLPERIRGKRIAWSLIAGSPNYQGSERV